MQQLGLPADDPALAALRHFGDIANLLSLTLIGFETEGL